MNIAVSVKATTFHKGFGGLETQNRVLCEGLVKKGHTVVVFSPKNEVKDTEITENGVRYIFVNCIKPKFSIITQWQKNSWYNMLLQSFAQENSKSKFNLFISQSSSGLSVINRKKDIGIPVISISHGTKSGEFQTRVNSINSVTDVIKIFIDLPHVILNFFTVQRSFVHGSNLVVAVSNAVKQSLIEETFVDERKIKVIHNGVNTQLIPENQQKGDEDFFEESKIKLLYVGQIAKEKGLDYLFDILSDKRFSNFQLIAVGGGTYLDEFKEKVKAAGYPIEGLWISGLQRRLTYKNISVPFKIISP